MALNYSVLEGSDNSAQLIFSSPRPIQDILSNVVKASIRQDDDLNLDTSILFTSIENKTLLIQCHNERKLIKTGMTHYFKNQEVNDEKQDKKSRKIQIQQLLR
jgi:hypothetical protein